MSSTCSSRSCSASARFAPGPAFLFRSGDPAALAARLDALLDDPAAYAAASAACLAVAPRFDLTSCVRDLERAYASVVHPVPVGEAVAVPARSGESSTRFAAQ